MRSAAPGEEGLRKGIRLAGFVATEERSPCRFVRADAPAIFPEPREGERERESKSFGHARSSRPTFERADNDEDRENLLSSFVSPENGAPYGNFGTCFRRITRGSVMCDRRKPLKLFASPLPPACRSQPLSRITRFSAHREMIRSIV